MPLTAYQAEVARALAKNRTEDSHLAGGAALHIEPNSRRYSNDLDYFTAFAADEQLLHRLGHQVDIEMKQPGYIRAVVGRGPNTTKVEWAHDSAWRFMPAIASPDWGYTLHPIDLAVNKVLALAGRDEPRDLLDILDIDERILPLGAAPLARAGPSARDEDALVAHAGSGGILRPSRAGPRAGLSVLFTDAGQVRRAASRRAWPRHRSALRATWRRVAPPAGCA